MVLISRKVVEQIAERGKMVLDSPEVVAGKLMPGYKRFSSAMEAQISFTEVDEHDQRKPSDK